jgi:alkylation response protein AidB-like acyl-CoA dehydrogenase
MNFDFSSEQIQLRDEARRFLDDKCQSSAVRTVLEGKAFYDRSLWAGLADMGFLGVAIPERYGGLGLGYLELCVIAEELGRVLAPVPFSSSVCLATEFLLAAGNDSQKARWLPRLASGRAIGTYAAAEATGEVSTAAIRMREQAGALSGAKLPVADGDIADFAVVTAQAPEGLSLYLVALAQAGVERSVVETIDPTKRYARLGFARAAAEPLGRPGTAWALIERVLDRAAVLVAFEQVGGASKALQMGLDYAQQRTAFGRPIGSFQAIKHMLVDMYVSVTLARSNAYYGAWALSTNAPELPEAAAAARISATEAYQHCARNSIQVHGGMGFTWDVDCHLHYRRANLLALSLGGLSQWQRKLIERLCARRTEGTAGGL